MPAKPAFQAITGWVDLSALQARCSAPPDGASLSLDLPFTAGRSDPTAKATPSSLSGPEPYRPAGS